MADLIMNDQDGTITSVSETPPTHYMVRLQSFSLLVKNNIEKYSTSEFEAGGYKWKLIFYPNGNKTKNITDYISLNIMLVESSLHNHGSEVHATFKLFLLDQNEDNYYTFEVGKGKGRRFHKMKPECGFNQFMPLKIFNDPSNGYLVNDTCIFGAEIYVYKENISGKGESLLMMKDPISHKHTWKIENYSNNTKEHCHAPMMCCHESLVSTPKIENYSDTAKEDCHESSPFNAGHYKWKMQMYPRGKGSGTGNHVSLYLALADPTSLPIGSQVYVEFTLRVLDQIRSNNYYGKAKYWFSGSNPFCGWPRFISLGYFNLPSNGLLVKDCCALEAEVTVHGITTVKDCCALVAKAAAPGIATVKAQAKAAAPGIATVKAQAKAAAPEKSTVIAV